MSTCLGDGCGVLLTSTRVPGLCQHLGLNKRLQARGGALVLPSTLPPADLPKAFLKGRAGEGEVTKSTQVPQVHTPVFLAKEFAWCGH